MKNRLNLSFLMLLLILIVSCGGPESNNGNKSPETTKVSIQVPDFNADSAYYFVEKQVSFGPRVPNSKAHAVCAAFFDSTLKAYTPHVIAQSTRVRAYDGTALNMTNFIASFKPETNNRIFLCAHWDSRHIAEKDPNPAMQNKPIDGANDGASGVGVLLEVARLLSIYEPPLGVDIILFDAEDYGQPHNSPLPVVEDSWALGSQYWARNPHKKGYFAKYGILLDMVGAKDATFLKEGYSMKYAPDVVKKVWQVAQRLGYGNYFINAEANAITDDHYYVNVILGIPTINIIHYDKQTGTGFFEHWHTQQDNMDNISRETLKAVGQTVLTVIFEEK